MNETVTPEQLQRAAYEIDELYPGDISLAILLRAAAARIEELEEALKRLGSREAFEGALDLQHSSRQAIDAEMSARINYARIALAGSRSDATESEA